MKYSIVLLLLFVISCEDQNKHTDDISYVYGIVVDNDTNRPISKCLISLQKEITHGIFYPITYTTVSQMWTNETGIFNSHSWNKWEISYSWK